MIVLKRDPEYKYKGLDQKFNGHTHGCMLMMQNNFVEHRWAFNNRKEYRRWCRKQLAGYRRRCDEAIKEQGIKVGENKYDNDPCDHCKYFCTIYTEPSNNMITEIDCVGDLDEQPRISREATRSS